MAFINDKCCHTGLSPLARGTPIKYPYSTIKLRFIPAGAGNTVVKQTLEVSVAVYPRWRGEHARLDATVAAMVGLSPLARGTLVDPRRETL